MPTVDRRFHAAWFQTAVLIGAILASFAVFAIWPGIDLWVSGLFYDPTIGFDTYSAGLPNRLRMAIWYLSLGLCAIVVICLAMGLWTRAAVLGVPRSVWTYIALLYLLGPGVLVDGLLKRFWGRARPAQIVEFGGTRYFTPPHEISDQCARNCSFVAGEMAGAVALCVAGVVLLWVWRPRMAGWLYRVGVGVGVGVSLSLPILAGLQRIASGRHFLSDVVFATLFILLIAVVLWAVMRRAGFCDVWAGVAPVDIPGDSPYTPPT